VTHAARDSLNGGCSAPTPIDQQPTERVASVSNELIREPLVLGVSQQDQTVQIRLQVQADLSWFVGHFPEHPILPGVVQTHWAIEFGRRYLSLPPRFRYMSNMKFMRFILPGTQLELRLQYLSAKSELHFEYHDGTAVCASGRIGFSDDSDNEPDV
jgi:3-hydroxymyristoyl/3-hydroxydecanoyl-(acyl carrier protein) dehydratase